MAEPGEGGSPVGTLPGEGEPPPSIIDPEGNFQEGWRDHLDEDIRAEKCLADIGNIGDLAKSFVNTKRLVGKDKVAIPTDKSTDEEWEAFYVAGGRPGTAEEYNLKRPEDLPEELYDAASVAAAQELFHKIGLNPRQAEALMAFNAQRVLAAEKEYQDAETTRQQETTDALHKDWGAAFEQKTHLGNVAIDQGTEGDDELQARVVERFGNDPDFIRFAANIGAKFDEHKIVHAPSAITESASEIDDKISEAMSADAFMDRKHAQHAKQVALVTELHKKKAELLSRNSG